MLEGGGAKGAFQFGCLLALREHNVEFDAIAGTSVGALNAALWSTNQLDWGRTFWETISFDKVYPLRSPSALFLPIAVLYALLRFIEDRLGRSAQASFFAGIVWVWYGCLPILGALLAVVFSLAYFLTGHGFAADWRDMSQALTISLIFLCPLVFLRLVELLGISAFTSKPLHTALTNQLSDKSFRVPTFATISVKQEVYDPDALAYVTTGIPPSSPIIIPQPVSRFIPQYVRLDSAQQALARQLLLASAALPYGVVPAVKGAVDGGLADNLPIYPVASLLACDVVLILRANSGTSSRSSLLRAWQRVDRLLRIAQYDAGTSHQANPRPIPLYRGERTDFEARKSPAEPLRSPANRVRVLTIAPDLPRLPPCQDFVRRTMNFSPKFTIPQVASGYALTKEKLASGYLDELRRTG